MIIISFNHCNRFLRTSNGQTLSGFVSNFPHSMLNFDHGSVDWDSGNRSMGCLHKENGGCMYKVLELYQFDFDKFGKLNYKDVWDQWDVGGSCMDRRKPSLALPLSSQLPRFINNRLIQCLQKIGSAANLCRFQIKQLYIRKPCKCCWSVNK